MKDLLTKDIEKKLKAQHSKPKKLSELNVIAKIFNPYGLGTWYLISQNPQNEDELFAIVDWMEIEVGSVSKNELSSLKVPPFGLPLERDKFFDAINAEELLNDIRGARMVSTNNYEEGGEIKEININKPTFVPEQVFVGYKKIPAKPLILE